MNFLNNIYSKSIEENEKQLQTWQNYLNDLKALDFNIFTEKLKVPALIPVGNRIFFRGELVHTNEITVALGADYFAKCSIKQAEILRQHRIAGAQSNFNELLKENEYLRGQLKFNSRDEGQEIIEDYNEDEDKAWREKHRENVAHYKQSNKSKELNEEISDEQLWLRLEELELREELETEYSKCDEEINNKMNTIDDIKGTEVKVKIENNSKVKEVSTKSSSQPSSNKSEILNKVIDEQKRLHEEVLQNITDLQNNNCKSDRLLSLLDHLEALDDYEDEINRIEDNSSGTEEEVASKETLKKNKPRVSFQEEEDDSETVEITFIHSDVTPDVTPYDPKKVIQKPSDIYEAFKVNKETTNSMTKPILLKESKYPITNTNYLGDTPTEVLNDSVKERDPIVLKDVVEIKAGAKIEENTRPMSLFKKKRMQK